MPHDVSFLANPKYQAAVKATRACVLIAARDLQVDFDGVVIRVDNPSEAVAEVVRQVVRLCASAGAERIWVGDSPVGMKSESELWSRTGMDTAVAGTPAELKAGIADDLRLELVLDPEAGAIETPQFAGPHTVVGNRIVATVPERMAGEAAAWARDLRRNGRIEEFSVSPATLEDAYVALVGSTTASHAAAIAINPKEDANVRAA